MNTHTEIIWNSIIVPIVKASDHNPFPNILSLGLSLFPFPSALSNSRNGTEGREFKEWGVEGKRLIKMISNLFLIKLFHLIHCLINLIAMCVFTTNAIRQILESRGIGFITYTNIFHQRSHLIILFILFPQTRVDIFCFLDFYGFARRYTRESKLAQP